MRQSDLERQYLHYKDEANRYKEAFEKSQDHVRALEKQIVSLEEQLERTGKTFTKLIMRKPLVLHPYKKTPFSTLGSDTDNGL